MALRKFVNIASGNSLSPNGTKPLPSADLSLSGHLGTNFSEISMKIKIFSVKKNAFENVVWKYHFVQTSMS